MILKIHLNDESVECTTVIVFLYKKDEIARITVTHAGVPIINSILFHALLITRATH